MRMSSATRKGDKGKSANASHPMNKENATHSSNKISSTTKASDPKNAETSKPAEQLNPKVLPTAEQLRIAQMISDSKRDDPDLPEKVNKLVELTNCSADAAIIALHDSNNDLDNAIVALLDGETEGDWEVSGKKKKPKQQAQASAEGADTVHGAGSGSGRGRDRDRSRGGRGGPPRIRGRGRGRDNKENVEDGDAEAVNGFRGRGSRSGHRMSNGPGREGPRGGRGGRGGYRGRPRGNPQSTDTWDDSSEYPALTNVEPWNNDFPSADDWDNEEYIGSLAETKVFIPSQAAAAAAAAAAPTEPAALANGATAGAIGAEPAAPTPQNPTQVHYSSINNSAQQGIDLNALLQKTSGITVVSSALQQPFLQYGQPATDALKAAMGITGPKSAKPLRPKIPSKIPSSAVEMPDDPVVSGLDVKFGTLDFGIEPSGFELGLDPTVSPAAATSSAASKQAEHHQSHGGKMEFSSAPAQPPAASSLPKPDSSLGGFSTSAPSAQQQSMGSTSAQVKATSSQASYPYGTSYAPPGAGTAASQAPTTQPAGAYPSSSQTSSGGVYSNSGSANSTYQGASNQTGYGTYGQQQSQQPQTTQAQPTQQQQQQQSQQPSTSTSYPAYNKMNTPSGLTDASGAVSNLRGDMPNTTASATSRAPAATTTTAAANKPASAAALAAGSSGLPNMPPGVPMLGPGSFIMGQGPALPYYAAAAAAAGMQQHPMYSLEEMQYRYPHLAAGYYDMGYQSPTSLGTGREGTLASLAYAGSDAKFSRNENNSPVPTSLSQNAAQSHGGAFISPAAAAATPLTPAYAYYYSGGVMPGGYQFGAPALYPVSAAASGHAGSGAAAQYAKGGPLGATASAAAPSGQTAGATGAGPAAATASGYASYGSTYDDYKSVYNTVGSAATQTGKIGGVGASTGPSAVSAAGSADLGVGPNVYGKTHNQLGKINTYDKTGGFHTGTPPPYGLAGNANAAPLGVGVNVGVGGPSPYGAQHMFIPTLAPHQSQHSHLMHQQLHQDSNSGAGQRSQSGGQQNKQGSKSSYGGSYWGSN